MELMSILQACEHFGVSRTVLRDLVLEGKVKPIGKSASGRTNYYSKAGWQAVAQEINSRKQITDHISHFCEPIPEGCLNSTQLQAELGLPAHYYRLFMAETGIQASRKIGARHVYTPQQIEKAKNLVKTIAKWNGVSYKYRDLKQMDITGIVSSADTKPFEFTITSVDFYKINESSARASLTLNHALTFKGIYCFWNNTGEFQTILPQPLEHYHSELHLSLQGRFDQFMKNNN